MEYMQLKNEETGETLHIYTDVDAPNPRTEFEQLCEFAVPDRCRYCHDEADLPLGWSSREADEKTLKNMRDVAVFAPLYVLDHSRVAFSLGAFYTPVPGKPRPFTVEAWDSGQIGYVVVKRETLKLWHPGWKRVSPKRKETLLRQVKAELDEYQAYYNGEMLRYTVEDDNEYYVDGCGGFYNLDDIKFELPEFFKDEKEA